MSRAYDLFCRLRDGGASALGQLIAEREPESLFLDFKRSPGEGAGRFLATEDNKNLSKAISGFANSSGGVVIWGVDCRRESETGNEVASRHPVSDADGLNTKLQAAISRATIPPHPDVQVLSFAEPENSPAGYVVVLVPQSQLGPIRSVVTNHYHLRTGSDFGIIPHDVLAGMFGRLPQPQIDMNLISYPARLNSTPGHFTIAFGLVAVNFGAVLAERPYLSVFFGNFQHDQITVRAPDPQAFRVRQGPLPTCSVVSSHDFVLAPGAAEHICDIFAEVPISQPYEIMFKCTLGAIGAPPKRFALSASREAVAIGITKARRGLLQSSEVLQLVHDA